MNMAILPRAFFGVDHDDFLESAVLVIFEFGRYYFDFNLFYVDHF